MLTSYFIFVEINKNGFLVCKLFASPVVGDIHLGNVETGQSR